MNYEHGNNMDNNLNFSTANIANPSTSAASVASPDVDNSLSTPMNGKEFAGLMRDLLNKSGRQELAASGEEGKEIQETTGSEGDGSSGLQTLTLGDQFAVITTAAPIPDADSLAAFARAQGLGESAVKALFGDIVSSSKDALNPMALAANSVNVDNPVALASIGWSTSLAASGDQPLTLTAGAMKAPAAPQESSFPTTATLNWLSTHPNALPISNQIATSVWAEAPHLSQSGVETPDLATPKVANLDKLLLTAGATAVVQNFGLPSALVPNAAEAAASDAQLNPELGPLDAMRMRLVPEWETMTKQLFKLNGNLQATTWSEIMSSKLTGKEGGLSGKGTLDLGSTDIGLDLGADLALAMAAGANDNTSATPLNATDNTKAPISLSALANSSISAQGDKAQLTDRAGQIQELANKLGQALGERLQNQMESGQWRLHLKLNPGHLGQIDVKLDMHAGGLDAVFRTENMLTKELITQGISKLKDSLAQSGTAVADVWVNSESKRESGGNPTPQRFAGNTGSETQADAAQPAQQVSRMIEKRSADEWDTLA
jgi:flagellar hook-length control protein FliK